MGRAIPFLCANPREMSYRGYRSAVESGLQVRAMFRIFLDCVKGYAGWMEALTL
jgi:hypothetical protein